MLLVVTDHATPYYDDSYGVNTANAGPYGDALTKELYPAIEKQFRAIGEPWARVVFGGSTGGWMTLAQQIFYPEYFGGAWGFCPDPGGFPRLPDHRCVRGHTTRTTTKGRSSGFRSCSAGCPTTTSWRPWNRSAARRRCWERADARAARWTPSTPPSAQPTPTAIRRSYGTPRPARSIPKSRSTGGSITI